MKKFILLILLFSLLSLKAQVGYVEYDNSVYRFLKKMNSLSLINNYDEFHLPKTRMEIASHLEKILINSSKLNSVDNDLLKEYLKEFEFEISREIEVSNQFLPEFDFNYIFNEKEKYLYSYYDSNKVSFFVNFVGSFESIFNKNRINSSSQSTGLVTYGGQIRGSFKDWFGFSVRTTNGTFFGDKNLALTKSNLKYNYKFNLPESSAGSNYFDETEAYALADFDFLKLKIGRDRNIIGYNSVNSIMSDFSPQSDYIGLSLNYKAFTFNFLHGKLFGNYTQSWDSLEGSKNIVDDKFYAYHRLGINLSKHFNFGLGEIVVYSNRNLDFSYLNPFNFYKSAEHSNQDRDNSMLFFDFKNNSISGLTLYGTILLDDIDFGKIGTAWFGNQAIVDLGIYSSNLNHILPLTLELQYLRIDPYVYTHRIFNNNYTSLNASLGSNIQPNSEMIHFSAEYTPHYKLYFKGGFRFVRHGANELNSDGSIKVNHGGNVLVGFRTFDNENASLLEGILETSRNYYFIASYELLNNYLFRLKFDYINESNQSIKIDDILTSVSFIFKI